MNLLQAKNGKSLVKYSWVPKSAVKIVNKAKNDFIMNFTEAQKITKNGFNCIRGSTPGFFNIDGGMITVFLPSKNKKPNLPAYTPMQNQLVTQTCPSIQLFGVPDLSSANYGEHLLHWDFLTNTPVNHVHETIRPTSKKKKPMVEHESNFENTAGIVGKKIKNGAGISMPGQKTFLDTLNNIENFRHHRYSIEKPYDDFFTLFFPKTTGIIFRPIFITNNTFPVQYPIQNGKPYDDFYESFFSKSGNQMFQSATKGTSNFSTQKTWEMLQPNTLSAIDFAPQRGMTTTFKN